MKNKHYTKKKLLVMSWAVPAVLWLICFLMCLLVDVVDKILSLDFFMLYSYLSHVFPIIATVIGVRWNIRAFRLSDEKKMRSISLFGAFFWLIFLVIIVAYAMIQLS